MDGLAAIRHLNHLHKTGAINGKETPVCVISAYNRDEIPQSDSDLYKAFLEKPVIASELFNAVMLATGGKIGAVHLANSGSVPSFEGYNILLVEDHELNQEVAKAFITKTGANVMVAENGELALRYHAENRFDLILMDLQMPVMSGFTATAEIRRRELESGAGVHLPIIALSAAVMENDNKLASEAGVDGHLGKPIDSQELYAVMGKYLQNRGAIATEIILPAKKTEAFPVLEGFDLERGKVSSLGNRDVYLKLLRSFHTQLSVAVTDFCARMTALTFKEIQHEAHTLKGTAATIGALRVAEAATAIDKTSAQKMYPTESMFHELRAAVISAIEQMTPYLTVVRIPVGVDEEEGLKATDKLLNNLHHSELADDALIETVVAFVEAQVGHEKAEALRTSIEQFDMQTAVEVLENFKKGKWA